MVFCRAAALASGRRIGLGAGLLALGLVGCSGGGPTATAPEAGAGGDPPVAQAERPVVVATTGVLCDLTQQIAETTVALTCLLDPGTDPHTYQVKPSDRQAIEQADLILYDGYGFAPTLIAMVEDSATEAARVAVYEAAVPTPLLGAAHDHGHDHGHDQDAAAHDDGHDDGHDHGAEAAAEAVPDPHIWHDAAHNAAMVAVIAERLAVANPTQADRYATNAERLATQFNAIDGWIQTQVATVPASARQLVTTHDAFGYFAEAYGFEVKGALTDLNADAKPTPGTLTALVEQVKAAQVPAIFAETTTAPQLIETVARDAGVTVAEQPLFVEGPGGPGTEAVTMQDLLVVNTCAIVEGLGGRCDRTTAPR